MNARRLALPVLALVAGLLVTVAAALFMARAEEGRRQARFDGLVDGVEAAIEARMLAQLTLLRGAGGFFNASERVTRVDFDAYVSRLRLERNYPGVLGIGYAAYAPDRAALDAIVRQAWADGMPQLVAAPPGERPDYSVILYLEPDSRMNAQAIGFDMMSEATRRAAMQASRRTGQTRMSGRVRLVQEIEPIKQPGVLIYTPLFRGTPTGSGELYGWVYSPLRAYDLFEAVFAESDLGEVVVEVFDEQVGPDHLLFRSGQPEAEPSYAAVQRMAVAGRTWIVRVTSTPAFIEDTAVPAPLGVIAAGALISLLISALLFLQIRSTRRTQEEVRLRTAELRTANEQLVAEADAREQAEAKVAQMQKVEAIGQLTGGIAHDFNNMLTIVIGNLDIAQRRIGQPERAAQAIANASEGAQKAAELTQRLLAFGRQQALRPQVIEPDALVVGLADMLRRTIGPEIRLETSAAPDVWTICADPAQLESAILNLAINARDAMPDGGALTIETGNVVLDGGDLPHSEGPAVGPHVRIAVVDTGHGMPPEVLERALDPFFTTKEVGRGTGLGLSQVYGFVRQSGGHFGIRSEVGRGTTVTIYLPRHATEAPKPAQGRPPAPPLPRARSGEAILVVEDEEQVREISTETLCDLGYTVHAASGGREALDLLDAHPDVALLFTDVVMPEMNGRKLADEALTRRPDLKLLFTTGYTRDAIVHDGRLDEAVTLLQKPFSAAQLAETVRTLLDSKEGQN